MAANYTDAALNTAIYKGVPELMNKAEFKAKPSATLMKYLKNTQFLIPATEMERALAIKATDTQTVKVNLLNKQATTTISARATAHTGSINTSRVQTASFTIYGGKFKYSVKGAERNIWELSDQIAAQIHSAAIAIHSAIETALLARLSTYKSQVVISASPRSGTWDGTNYILGIAQADKSYWMQKIKGFMREQYYTGQFDAVVDETLMQEFERIANQGAGNSQNLAFQVGGVTPSVTEELSLDASYDGQGYIFPVGSIGILPWTPPLNKTPGGYGSSGEAGGFYTTIPDPLGSGLTFALHQYKTGADNQSAAGQTQDIDIQMEMTVDLAPVEANTSTSNEYPIFKFGILT